MHQIKACPSLPSFFFCSILVRFPVFYQTLLVHLTHPFYMTGRQPHHITAREQENGSRPMPHAVRLIHLSLSGRERERALRRSSSLSAQASGTSCLSSPLTQTKCVRPRDVFISEISSLHLLCSLSFEKNIYMQIHKLAPLAHEFTKVTTTNIMLPPCTTYTRKCVPGERVFGSEHPHQSDESYRCTHALVELSCRFRAARAAGGQVWVAHTKRLLTGVSRQTCQYGGYIYHFI
jgi:hypothetical protein